MKKTLITLWLSLITLTTFSQIPKQQKFSDFNTWSLSGFGNINYSNFDLIENEPLYSKVRTSYGWGVSFAKQLSHFSGFKVTYNRVTFDGTSPQQTYKTNIQQLDARFHFNVTNGQILKNWRNTQLYAYAGYGILFFDNTKTKVRGTDTILSVTNQTRVLPAGIGFKYRLGNRSSLFADVTYNITNSDMLDGWSNVLTSKDGFTQISVGYNYTFGKKKVLEWDNPYQYLVPDVVHDTTTIIQRIEYVPPIASIVEKDSSIIYFAPGSWEIEMPYLDELDKLIERANKHKYHIIVQAYVGATGSSKTNIEVVTKRGEKISQYIKRVLSDEFITVELYDESYATYAPDARNRKAVIKLVK